MFVLFFNRNWNDETERSRVTGKKPSLTRALTKTFFRSWVVIGIVAVFEVGHLNICVDQWKHVLINF